jgi:hypothetical protein
MLYMRFERTAPAVFTAFVSNQPIAHVIHDKNGLTRAWIGPGRAVSRDELSCLSLFMQQRGSS